MRSNISSLGDRPVHQQCHPKGLETLVYFFFHYNLSNYVKRLLLKVDYHFNQETGRFWHLAWCSV